MMTKVANYWSRHLQAIDREGISAAAYARREGLQLSCLYSWRNRFKATTVSLTKQINSNIATSTSVPNNQLSNTNSNFIAVELAQSLPVVNTPSSACSITLANAVNIELAQLPPAVWLAQLVNALAVKQL